MTERELFGKPSRDINLHASSGMVTVQDLRQHQKDALARRSEWTYSSWVIAPASWSTKQTLMTYAHNSGVTIEFDVEKTGWLFKVTGTEAQVDLFVSNYKAYVEANSS